MQARHQGSPPTPALPFCRRALMELQLRESRGQRVPSDPRSSPTAVGRFPDGAHGNTQRTFLHGSYLLARAVPPLCRAICWAFSPVGTGHLVICGTSEVRLYEDNST